MIKILIPALAAAAAIVGPASGQSITVNLAGKDPAAQQAEILRAAKKVCRRALQGSLLEFQGYGSCVADTVRSAEAARFAAIAKPERVAAAR